MDNLNKENFFDEMQEKYPTATHIFYDWIDAYKHEVNWNYLFGHTVKFHDLPIEMQMGIIHRFYRELVVPKSIGPLFFPLEDKRLWIKLEIFEQLQKHLSSSGL